MKISECFPLLVCVPISSKPILFATSLIILYACTVVIGLFSPFLLLNKYFSPYKKPPKST